MSEKTPPKIEDYQILFSYNGETDTSSVDVTRDLTIFEVIVAIGNILNLIPADSREVAVEVAIRSLEEKERLENHPSAGV